MPYMKILTLAVLKISLLTRFVWQRRKRGITLPYKVEKKELKRVRLFFVLMLQIKFQVPSASGSLVLQPTTLLYW